MTLMKMDNEDNVDPLSSLIARAKLDRNPNQDQLPPVDRWNPPFCGDLDMMIKADGTWFYMGTPIGRPQMVRLFSSVLRKDDDGKTYLVTPVEKVGITVEDAHFLAVEMNVQTREGVQEISFRTNMGDVITAGKSHPLRFEVVGEQEELKPYILVRGRLEALVNRATIYELMECAQEMELNGQQMLVICSDGEAFPIMAMQTLRDQIDQGAT